MSRRPSTARRKKPAKKITMNDLHNQHVKDSVPLTDHDKIPEEDPLSDFKFDDDLERKLVEYNASISTLDPDYLQLIPRNDVLVRVFVKELEKTEAGLYLPNKAQVQVPTRSGVGIIGEMESPYPYSQKAVVVSVPPYITDLKAGDVVILASPTVLGTPVGQGDDAMITVRYGFTHPDFYSERHLPADPSNKNYGYLAVPSTEIKFIQTSK